jgi:hypothetical protein
VSSFEDEWRARFELFARAHDSEAGISGWSETGLERRVHLFRSLVPAASPGPPPVALELGCGAGTYVRSFRARLSRHQPRLLAVAWAGR